MAAQQPRLGGNLVLASLLAILSYVPFELVAKGSLIVCTILFILDPIPPASRLLSLVSLFLVAWLSKLYKAHQQENEISIEQDPTNEDKNHEKKE